MPNCFPYHYHSVTVHKNLLWSQQTLTTLMLGIEYVPSSWTLQITGCFRPVRSDVPAEKPKHFMKLKFLNKAADTYDPTINISH